MEVIKINGEKLKVMLSPEDMRHYAVNCDTLDGESAASRFAFRRILADARGRCGFDAVGARVFVQVFPSKEGGCEMFVTKLADGTGTLLQTESRRKFFYVYSFERLNQMLTACAAIRRQSYIEESYAYADPERKRYFLTFETDVPNMSEYGGRKCRVTARYYIGEHCKLICENAVARLAELA